jgi:hypothetical protein
VLCDRLLKEDNCLDYNEFQWDPLFREGFGMECTVLLSGAGTIQLGNFFSFLFRRTKKYYNIMHKSCEENGLFQKQLLSIMVRIYSVNVFRIRIGNGFIDIFLGDNEAYLKLCNRCWWPLMSFYLQTFTTMLAVPAYEAKSGMA